jgi:tetraacyldisaccharide-1-P 4'-kinase
VADRVEKADHHDWTQAEAKELAARAVASHCDLVLTTAKDAVKLERLAWPAGAPPLRALEVEVVLTRGADLWKTLLDEALA